MEEWHLFHTLGKRNSEFWQTWKRKMSKSQEEKVEKIVFLKSCRFQKIKGPRILHIVSALCFGIPYLESLQNQKLYLIPRLSYISHELNNNLSTWPLGCSISQRSLVWTRLGMFTLTWRLLVIGWNLATVMIEAQCWNQAVSCPKLLHTVQNNGIPSWCVLRESIWQVAFGSNYRMEEDCTPEWTY